MRAYRVTSPGCAEFVDIPTPHAGPGEVRLRVTAVGLCHSDVFIRQAPPALRQTLPVTLGHEVIDTVDEVGEVVTDWQPGTSAAVYVLIGCGRCPACARGQDNLCRIGHRGIGTHLRDGYVDVDRRAAAAYEQAGVGIPVSTSGGLMSKGHPWGRTASPRSTSSSRSSGARRAPARSRAPGSDSRTAPAASTTATWPVARCICSAGDRSGQRSPRSVVVTQRDHYLGEVKYPGYTPRT